MQRSLIVSALILAFAAPAAAQDSMLVAPASTPTIYTAPRYAQTYEYGGRGRGARLVIGTRHEQRPDGPLWGGGLAMFLAGWALDIAITAGANAISHDRTDAAEQDAQAWSIVPLVGPLVQLGIEAPHPAIPIFTELLQIGGLVMFVLGLTNTHDTEVPIYAFGDPHDARSARLGMGLATTAGGAYATITLHTM